MRGKYMRGQDLESWCTKIPQWQLERAIELLASRRVPCFGYIHTAYSKDRSSNIITEDIRLWLTDIFKECAACLNGYLDPKMVFFPENVDSLIDLLELDGHVEKMNYKYLIVYEFDDFYSWWGETEKKKQKKLATLCHLKNIEVISASEELGHD